MDRGKTVRLVLSAALVLLFASAVASPRPAMRSSSINATQALKARISSSQARTLEERVSRLRPVRTMVAATPPLAIDPGPGDADRNTTEAATGNTASDPPETTISVRQSVLKQIPTTTRRPPRNSIQYVPTDDPAIDRDINNALASQQSIQGQLGSGGVITLLPGILRLVDGSGEEFQLKGVAMRSRGLVYDAALHQYRGSILLGLTDIVPNRPARRLSTPVLFQIIGADHAEPAQVSVDRTNVPYQEIQLAMSASRPVRVVSDAIQDGAEVDLPLEKSLTIEPGHTAIEGLGLGTTPINISLVGHPHPVGIVVTLHTDAGYLEPTRVRLDADGMASVTIRSDGLGGANIAATGPGLDRAETAIDFRPPYITFLASLIGGLVGGVIRSRGRLRVVTLMVAALCGLLICALYAVGINVLPFTPSVTVGATLVFAISGLGGFYGPGVLRRT